MESSTNSDWLKDKQVAFAGKLASMSRAEAAQIVKTCGGTVVPAVNEQTDFVVVGQESELLTTEGKPTAQIRTVQRLQKLGATIDTVSEEEFLKRSGLDSFVQTVHQLYTGVQISRFLKIAPDKFARWVRHGLVEPVETKHGVSFYDFQQVSWAKTLSNLTTAGVKPERIRQSLRQLKGWLTTGDPAAQLGLLELNGRLMVRLQNGQLAETHGQPLLDFGEQTENKIIQTSSPAKSAQDWFTTGLALEEQEKYAEASDAYLQSLITGGPDAVTCFNLANVHHKLGQKERAAERYHQVVEIDPGFAEAWSNLGNVLAELGHIEQAVAAMKHAVEIDPASSSYRYNLADLLDENGEEDKAKTHWRTYLQLENTGECADYARRRLASSK